ncbi:MAG: SDR family oxidoreductase [Rhodobacterales bacterium]|jgi:uncharacterized protein YbjT (DUF2867 family)|tara:strand:+ start:421 stop:1275 length:855 start_codon:yes stop_codon:yes gene_type:complete
MIVIFGATGTIGTHLISSLSDKGIALRAVTSDASRIAALKAQGCEAMVADFDDPAALTRACKGAQKAFLVTPAHQEMGRWKANVVHATADAGVQHMVMSTGLGASPKARLTFGIWHSASQELLKESGMGWTLIQPTYFMQNLLWQSDSIANENTYLDDVGGPVSWVDARDIADVSTEALTGEGHLGKAYGLTGDEALSGDDIAALLTQTLGRDITRRAVGPDEARANMITSGMVAEVADAMIELAGLAPKGYLSGTETTVQDVLGRPARRFADFITENAAAFGR